MHRLVALLLFLTLLGSLSPVVAAQDSSTKVAKVGSNPIGEPITVYSAEGSEAAQITVVEVIDPFEDWSEYGEPQRGERYVLVNVEIEVTGQRPFEFVPYNFYLLDSIGHLFSLGYVSRSDQSMVENPDLEEGNLLPEETSRGGLSYRIPMDAELTQVVYTGYNDVQQLYLLADLTAAATPEAD